MNICSSVVEPEQIQWLQKELLKSQAAKHVFVLGSYALLPTYENPVKKESGAEQILKLFKQHRVSAYLFSEIRKDSCRLQDGTYHISSPNLGGRSLSSYAVFHVFKDQIILGRRHLSAHENSSQSLLYEKCRLISPRTTGRN